METPTLEKHKLTQAPLMAFEIPKSLITLDVRAPLFMSAQTIVTAILICRTPKSSLLRPACLPVLVYLMYLAWQATASFTGQSVLYSFWWVGPYANIFHCMNNLYFHSLDKSDIRHEMRAWETSHSRSRPTPADPGLMRSVYFTTTMLLSFRGVGTTHQIRHIPPFPGGVVPSRTRFLWRQILIVALQYIVMDLLGSSPPPPEVADGWAEGKEWLWVSSLNPHSVTSQDLKTRLIGCTMNWYIVGRVMNDIWYRVFSIIFVGSGLTEPGQWPPLYGSYRDTQTLRGYFGKFWHQTLRWPFQGVSSYITRQILGLRRGTVERYANIFLVFFLSGTLHSILDVAFGGRWNPSGGLLCFSLLPVGMVLEDVIQRLWYGPSRASSSQTTWFARAAGHVWVIFFLAFWTPVFNYPLQRIDGNPTYLVPWSIVGNFV
ncbi:membrane bound O-acyl transferase family-domain-containing protein [Xylariales sp. AK1849]|nr:membrane bound O-acyl transferase family-domain-containing protein [Xylariales sp. AK1849]